VPLEHRDSSHLQGEVGRGESELRGSPVEDEHVVDAAVVAPFLVVREPKVVAGAGTAQDPEAVAGEVDVVEGDVEVKVPPGHDRTLTQEHWPLADVQSCRHPGTL
jgi:hypothetical protein